MVNSKMSQNFSVLLENLMSVSIGGGRAEQNAVRKSYQVQVASFGGDGNDTCTYHYHPTRVMMSLTRWHFYFSPKKRALLPPFVPDESLTECPQGPGCPLKVPKDSWGSPRTPDPRVSKAAPENCLFYSFCARWFSQAYLLSLLA